MAVSVLEFMTLRRLSASEHSLMCRINKRLLGFPKTLRRRECPRSQKGVPKLSERDGWRRFDLLGVLLRRLRCGDVREEQRIKTQH